MRLLFFYLFFLSLPLSAKTLAIFETEYLRDLLPYIEEKTLLILDIDNTLIAPKQQLGSDEWAWNEVKKLQAEGFSKKEALEKTMEKWRQIHSITEVATGEKETAFILERLMKQNLSLIALTTRYPEDAELTLRELESAGIYFKSEEELSFEPLPARFISGILFATLECSKGQILSLFFEKSGHLPKRVIFIDDKLHHIQDVASACLQLDLDYVGIRYSAFDKRLKDFDPEISEIQWFFRNHILSDEQASHLR